jgi:hypothetical protein
MTRKYKISSIIYSGILIFSLLFMFMLLGASGHKVKFDFWDYLIPVYPIINIILLYALPRVSEQNKNTKIFISFFLILFLMISLYFALRNLFEIFSGDLILEFITFALIVSSIFIASIIFLVIEILKKSNTSR